MCVRIQRCVVSAAALYSLFSYAVFYASCHAWRLYDDAEKSGLRAYSRSQGNVVNSCNLLDKWYCVWDFLLFVLSYRGYFFDAQNAFVLCVDRWPAECCFDTFLAIRSLYGPFNACHAFCALFLEGIFVFLCFDGGSCVRRLWRMASSISFPF